MGKEIDLDSLQIPAGATGNVSIKCPECSSSRKKSNLKTLSWHVEKQVGTCKHCGLDLFIKTNKMPAFKIQSTPDLTPPMLAYMKNRGLSPETLKCCHVDYAKEYVVDKISGKGKSVDCFAFKYLNNNVLRMVKLRAPNKSFAIKKAKGKEMIFYGLDDISNSDWCILVEGEMDKLSYYEAGIKNCISVPAGAKISQNEKEYFELTGNLINENVQDLKYLTECIDSFKDKKKIYLATDADPAGYKLQEELVRRLGKHRCYKIKFHKYSYTDSEGKEKKCKDANELLMNLGSEALVRTIEDAEEYPIEHIIKMSDTLSALKHQYQHGVVRAKSSGYKCLNNNFNLLLGTPLVLNGMPNMGKTSFTFQIMLNTIVLYGWKWLIFSPENYPHERLVSTLVNMLVGKPIDKKYPGVMSLTEMESAVSYLNEYVYILDDKDEGWDHSEIRDTVASFVERKGINCCLIDPFNSATKGLKSNLDRESFLNIELSAYTRLAISCNVLVWINAHPKTLDKQYQNNAPHVMDLAGGVMFFNKMYLAACIHIQNREDPENTISELHVDKVKFQNIQGIPTRRSCPPTLTFKRKNQRYYERLEDGSYVCPLDSWKSKEDKQQDLKLEYEPEPLTSRVEVEF